MGFTGTALPFFAGAEGGHMGTARPDGSLSSADAEETGLAAGTALKVSNNNLL